jgi:hypothetical protein
MVSVATGTNKTLKSGFPIYHDHWISVVRKMLFGEKLIRFSKEHAKTFSKVHDKSDRWSIILVCCGVAASKVDVILKQYSKLFAEIALI